MARQYHLERGEGTRSRFIARRQSYHGNTLGALAVGGNVWRREPYAPILIEASHISPCYAYRDMQDGESEQEYGLRVANELDTEIRRLGAENVCAFIAETVGGATAGVIPPVEGYFKRIREICDEHGVIMILDEVMCGMGRTGTLFRLRTRWRGTGHRLYRQGPRRRLSADRGDLGDGTRLRDFRAGFGRVPARAHIYGPSDGLCSGARRATQDRKARSHGRGCNGKALPWSINCMRVSATMPTWATFAVAAYSKGLNSLPTGPQRPLLIQALNCTHALKSMPSRTA